jgi:predicted aspartyl protease
MSGNALQPGRGPRGKKFFGPFFQKTTAFFLFLSSPAAACQMSLIAQLPLSQTEKGPTVTASVNSKPATLIFDTGSFTTIFTNQAAVRLDMRLLKSEAFSSVRARLSGIGGSVNALGIVAHRFELGRLHAKDYNFLQADFLHPPLDGLLSIDLLSRYDIDLDFPEQQVRLFQPNGDCSAPAAFMPAPLYVVPLEPNGEDRRPRVKVTVGDKELVALIDTGAHRSAIFRGAAERLGLIQAIPQSGKPFTVEGLGHRKVSAVRRAVDSLAIGDLSFDRMPFDILEDRAGDSVEMLLGADFQRLVHVWISYSSHSLILEYPSQPSKKIAP